MTVTRSAWSDAAKARMSEAMRKRWKDPDFVDKQIRAMAARWQNPTYRRRQIEAIQEGRRKAPFATAGGDMDCTYPVPLPGDKTHPCSRRDKHRFHVAVTGNAADWSLRVYGFHDEANWL